MLNVISLSGGLDSTTLLHSLLYRGVLPADIIPVQFVYGSKHNPFEVEAVDQIVNQFGLASNLIRIDLTVGFSHLSSALLATGDAIPEGHYNDETMRQTVVPGRNLIFASFCAAVAESKASQQKTTARVLLGVHSGDHLIYPDCRPAFVRSLNDTIRFSSDARVHVEAPFTNVNKADIVKLGLKMGTPYELTRTCYKAQGEACGVCGSCRERLEAFHINNAADPIRYHAIA